MNFKTEIQRFCLFALCFSVLSSGVGFALQDSEETEDYAILHEIINNEFNAEIVSAWGAEVIGVRDSFSAERKQLSLVLTACGEEKIDFDERLLSWIQSEGIPVSVFTDYTWLKSHGQKFKPFILSEKIQVENHGLKCREFFTSNEKIDQFPNATQNLEEAFVEIEKNARHIERFTGRLPYFYRSGHQQYDDVSVRMAQVLGYEVVSGNVRLEGEKDFTVEHVKSEMARVKSGDILVVPLNQSTWSLSAKVPKIVSYLKSKGFLFVGLEDVSFSQKN